jgi:hypothetical protein
MTDATNRAPRGRLAIGWAALAIAACGGPAAGPETADGGTAGGACGSDAGTCNAVVDVATPITPTCASGAVPTGTGGTIEDGTYVLTSQTYYGAATCPATKISTTVVIAGGCFQLAAHAFEGDGGSFELRASSVGVVQGSYLTLGAKCVSVAGTTPDAPMRSFTVSGPTLTLFTANAAAGNGNPDRAEVLVKQ